jgi:serine/threonine protein kinase
VTRYELLDRIGVGGMAEIFRGKAVAAGGFEKPVAIKRILPHLSQDKRFVELLIAEAKVLSLLRHRNIVQIFDVGLGDDGQYFLVMEYVDGKDLGAVQRGLESRRKKLAFDLALHITAEICEALEHAHIARAPDGKPMALVHRDVSPSNVLLSRAGEVKLTDFGIAKRAESEQTGHGGVRGKFAYISPEQARNEQVGPRSDVFSVGILLWELVCNRRLFSQLPDLEALRAVREPTNIQRPSEVDPRIPRGIDDIVLAALGRERERRPSAAQLGQQLRALRYSLETTVGDPAAELARVIETAEQVQQESSPLHKAARPTFDSIDQAEMTVIRIRTADAFSQRDNDRSIAQARQVIDRFEEEETRLAQLSGEQLRQLRSTEPTTRDSGEASVATPPLPDRRALGLDEEPTQMRGAIEGLDLIAARNDRRGNDSGEQLTTTPPFDGEATRLVAPRDRRTPVPERRQPSASPQPRRPTEAPKAPPPPRRATEGPPSSPVPPPPPAGAMTRDQTAMPPPGFPPPEPPPAFPPPPHGSYPPWGRTDQPGLDAYNQPLVMPAPAPMPQGPPIGGYESGMANLGPGTGPPLAFKPWMLVVGAVLMALLAFAITRTLISG